MRVAPAANLEAAQQPKRFHVVEGYVRRSASTCSGSAEYRRATKPKPSSPLWATSRHGFLASGFATSRAQSMKRCTAGLGVRFFNMMIPIGALAIGSSTGNFPMNGCSEGNRRRNSGRMER